MDLEAKVAAAIVSVESEIPIADEEQSKASQALWAANNRCSGLRGDLAKLKQWIEIGRKYGLIEDVV